MSVPEHLWRFSTTEARVSLASKLNLPYTPNMQDWECEVSDPNRVAEFITLYKVLELTDDELFSLMELIIWSFIELGKDIKDNTLWKDALSLISLNLDTHIYTVWYWSEFEDPHYYYLVRNDLKAVRDANRERYA